MQPTLTFRQQRFVLEYLKDQNASAAAARAGYTAQNMASQGNELMKNPAIRERVREEMQSLLAEIRCSALELMQERMRAAFFRGDKLIGDNWEPIPLDQLDEDTRDGIEVSVVMRKSGPVVRVKQPDRDKALRALEKAHARLDQLNQRYWEKLEKEGQVQSLEEIEAMDGGGVQGPADDFSQKHQVLSGSGEPGQAGGFNFSEKHQVLSGSRDRSAMAA
jgi:phage terminase small subunit